MIRDPLLLSPAGLARRDAMLRELTDEMRRINRRRRLRARVTAAGWLVVAGAAAAVAARAHLGPSPGPSLAEVASPARRPACVIEIVRNDPAVLERCRAASSSSVEMLDDQALLHVLARIDRPTGLVRRGDHVYPTGLVTDADLREDHDRKEPSSSSL